MSPAAYASRHTPRPWVLPPCPAAMPAAAAWPGRPQGHGPARQSRRHPTYTRRHCCSARPCAVCRTIPRTRPGQTRPRQSRARRRRRGFYQAAAGPALRPCQGPTRRACPRRCRPPKQPRAPRRPSRTGTSSHAGPAQVQLSAATCLAGALCPRAPQVPPRCCCWLPNRCSRSPRGLCRPRPQRRARHAGRVGRSHAPWPRWRQCPA
mmetsp:Transcript_22046/g.68177  ORF Transcript_22046/g.68177 Transcript_22046/m.68177 type:complete len:207 (-) Transcript_22046:474-1094(-)